VYNIFSCSVSDAIYKRKIKFLIKQQHLETHYADSLKKNIDEMTIVHFVQGMMNTCIIHFKKVKLFVL